MPRCSRSVVVSALICVLAPAAAVAWEPPPHWDEVGAVATWQELDGLFYRIEEDPVFLNRSHDRLDQRSIYDRTLEYRGSVTGIGLAAWAQLDPPQQEERRKLARRELDFVVRFRQRMETLAQRTRENEESFWGARPTDVTVVGDSLTKLRTAVAIDPSNPWAWHLYAWFAGIVGDLGRAEQALAGAEAALTLVPEHELPELRAAVALQAAWLAWDQGDAAAAAAAVERAAGLDADPFDVILLRGLAAARLGDLQAAFTWANRLRQVIVKRYPPDYRTSGPAPERNNVAVWRSVRSDFAERWIKALAWIEAGRLDMAAKAFGSYHLTDIFPQAHRFWNDAGMIYELTGREALADRAWNQARMCAPFAPFFPYKPYDRDLGRLTGRPGNVPFYLAFDRFFLAGSRLAHAAALVEAVAAQTDDVERQAAAALAFDGLDACLRHGQYRAQASLLKGEVYHRLGDTTAAVIEVEEALRQLRGQEADPGARAVLAELTTAGAGRRGADFLAFYGQSGSSRGRWAAPRDPAAELAALEQAYAERQDDESRRDLARFLIRNGQPDEGRALVDGRDAAPDLVLRLEADRVLDDAALARELAGRLLATGQDPWADAELWTLAGFMCLEDDDDAAGRRALERALELDPGNLGLKIQLQLMDAGSD